MLVKASCTTFNCCCHHQVLKVIDTAMLGASFKLYMLTMLSCRICLDLSVCAAAVNNLAQATEATYTVSSAGYVPVGLNFISR